jgi:hypothetical protein
MHLALCLPRGVVSFDPRLLSVCEGVAICWSESIRLRQRCEPALALASLERVLFSTGGLESSPATYGCALFTIARLAQVPPQHSLALVIDEKGALRYLDRLLLDECTLRSPSGLFTAPLLAAVSALLGVLPRETSSPQSVARVRSAWLLAADVAVGSEALPTQLTPSLLALARTLFHVDSGASLLPTRSREQLVARLDQLLSV